MSRGCPRLLSGMYRTICSCCCSSGEASVSENQPRPMAFTRTLLRPHSKARERVSCNTAPWESDVATELGRARSASTDVMFTIRPDSRATMPAHQRHDTGTDTGLMSRPNIAPNSLTGVSSKGRKYSVRKLFTRTSMLPPPSVNRDTT